MKDYIERDKVLKDLLDQCKITGFGGLTPRDVKYVFSLQTNADVRPVVRGKWEQKEVFEAKGRVDELQSAFCPVCQRYHTTPYSYYFTQYNFCPNCGADMRGEN